MSSTQQQPLVHKVNEPTLLFHTNLFIISVFALCFLIILPRIIYKLSTRDGWVEGHFFRRSTFRPRPARPSLIPSATSASSSYSHSLAPLSIASPTSASEKRGFWGGGQTPISPSDAPSSASSWFPGVSVSRSSSSSSTQSSASVGESYPPHIAFTPSFLIPVSKWLKRRLAYKSDRSYGQTLVQITWLAILMYPTFYKSSGPLKDPLRIGWVAVSQLPFLFVLSAKNGILGALLGVGYHKVNFLHRFAGRLVVFGSNLHALGYIYKWSLAGTFTEMISRPKTYWALVALVAINLLFFLSTSFIRHNFFNFFLFMHIASWLVLLPTLYFHGKRMAPYLLACVAVTTLDRVMRVMKTRVSEALIKPVPELGGTRIEIPGIEGWEAGQHVRIRILSSGMGLNHSFGASHPFTIASPSGGRSGLVLYCKKSLPESGTTGRGNWTNRLYELAKVKGYLSKEEQGGVGRKIKVMVQGPYGGPDSHTVLASYSAAVFVVGGSGISYALSGIQEMLGKDYKNQSRVRQIELMWMVRDPSCLVPMMETFSAMLRKSASVMTSLKISVYYTRAPVGGVLPFKDDDPILSHPDMLSLSPGRPRIGKTIEGVMSRLVRLGTSRKTRGKITGMVVCVCGPKGLAGDVSDAVNQLDPARCARIGGVEVHEEVFGL